VGMDVVFVTFVSLPACLSELEFCSADNLHCRSKSRGQMLQFFRANTARDPIREYFSQFLHKSNFILFPSRTREIPS
jgi:hypothetical protein